MRKTKHYQIDVPEKADFADIDKVSEAFDNFDQQLYELIYPVGSIYLSAIDVDPTDLFGGEWMKIRDAFLLASGTRQVGETGGEETHRLSLEEMPYHRHKPNTPGEYFVTSESPNAGVNKTVATSSGTKYFDGQNESGFHHRTDTEPVGSNAAHNNMPPYLTVHMWKRLG